MPMPMAASGKPGLPLRELERLHRVGQHRRRDQAGDRPDEDLAAGSPAGGSGRARTADQASLNVSARPPSGRAAGTRGIASAATSPIAETAASSMPPSQARPPVTRR